MVAEDRKTSETENRRLAYKRLYCACKILGDTAKGLQGCHAWRQFDKLFAEIAIGGANRAYFRNLQTCKSIWICPICSLAKSKLRRQKMARIVEEERKLGHSMALLTYTVQHKSTQPLAEIQNLVTEAHRLSHSGRDAQQNRWDVGYNGSIRSIEVTTGVAGWHFHMHELISVKTPLTRANTPMVFEPMRDEYLYQVKRLGGFADEIRGFDAVCAYGEIHSYVGKWGIVPELVSTSQKRGRLDNLAPFQLLDCAFKSGAQWMHPRAKFDEYAHETRGLRQLVPSPSWRGRMVDQDEQGGKPEPIPAEVQLTDDQMREIRRLHSHVEVLEAIENGEFDNLV